MAHLRLTTREKAALRWLHHGGASDGIRVGDVLALAADAVNAATGPASGV